ncbi:histidine phosphatase family protein [Cytophagales bacterium LB-30]|uniref:Histidine phosphatase family protein n=1 Tax=Shiella aurantiaca TaxID=3058365 RepID=A0ABT8F201_9BACT|nr:histidine phosphatase family protein [Shiella aurantiaca]MDN4164324.1 histidine phosphatase family protein [Shiella aurantiaca]
MKDLFLIRHAEAAQASSRNQDFDRMLTSEGMREAKMLGVYISEQNIKPQFMLASAAPRALETARLILSCLDNSCELIEQEDLYEASPRILLKAINEIAESKAAVALVGHNPTISYLAEYLTQEEVGQLPTAGMVHIRLENMLWAEVSQATGRLIQIHP